MTTPRKPSSGPTVFERLKSVATSPSKLKRVTSVNDDIPPVPTMPLVSPYRPGPNAFAAYVLHQGERLPVATDKGKGRLHEFVSPSPTTERPQRQSIFRRISRKKHRTATGNMDPSSATSSPAGAATENNSPHTPSSQYPTPDNTADAFPSPLIYPSTNAFARPYSPLPPMSDFQRRMIETKRNLDNTLAWSENDRNAGTPPASDDETALLIARTANPNRPVRPSARLVSEDKSQARLDAMLDGNKNNIHPALRGMPTSAKLEDKNGEIEEDKKNIPEEHSQNLLGITGTTTPYGRGLHPPPGSRLRYRKVWVEDSADEVTASPDLADSEVHASSSAQDEAANDVKVSPTYVGLPSSSSGLRTKISKEPISDKNTPPGRAGLQSATSNSRQKEKEPITDANTSHGKAEPHTPSSRPRRKVSEEPSTSVTGSPGDADQQHSSSRSRRKIGKEASTTVDTSPGNAGMQPCSSGSRGKKQASEEPRGVTAHPESSSNSRSETVSTPKIRTKTRDKGTGNSYKPGPSAFKDWLKDPATTPADLPPLPVVPPTKVQVAITELEESYAKNFPPRPPPAPFNYEPYVRPAWLDEFLKNNPPPSDTPVPQEHIEVPAAPSLSPNPSPNPSPCPTIVRPGYGGYRGNPTLVQHNMTYLSDYAAFADAAGVPRTLDPDLETGTQLPPTSYHPSRDGVVERNESTSSPTEHLRPGPLHVTPQRPSDGSEDLYPVYLDCPESSAALRRDYEAIAADRAANAPGGPAPVHLTAADYAVVLLERIAHDGFTDWQSVLGNHERQMTSINNLKSEVYGRMEDFAALQMATLEAIKAHTGDQKRILEGLQEGATKDFRNIRDLRKAVVGQGRDMKDRLDGLNAMALANQSLASQIQGLTVTIAAIFAGPAHPATPPPEAQVQAHTQAQNQANTPTQAQTYTQTPATPANTPAQAQTQSGTPQQPVSASAPGSATLMRSGGRGQLRTGSPQRTMARDLDLHPALRTARPSIGSDSGFNLGNEMRNYLQGISQSALTQGAIEGSAGRGSGSVSRGGSRGPSRDRSERWTH